MMRWRWTCHHWVGVSAIEFESPSLGSSRRRCIRVAAIAFESLPLHSSHCRCVRISRCHRCVSEWASLWRSSFALVSIPIPASQSLHPCLTRAQILSSSSPRTRLTWTSSSSSRRPHPRLNFLIRRLSELVFSSSKSPPSSLLARLRMNTRPSPCMAGIPGLKYSLPVHGLGGPEGLVGVRRR